MSLTCWLLNEQKKQIIKKIKINSVISILEASETENENKEREKKKENPNYLYLFFTIDLNQV